jgi:hypothetical protein
LDAAVVRLEAGFSHLETAVSQKFDRDEAEIARLRAEVAKAEAAYADALALNRTAAEQLDQSIGRLHGLIPQAGQAG